MEIKFDTTTITPRDASALRAFLMSYAEYAGEPLTTDQITKEETIRRTRKSKLAPILDEVTVEIAPPPPPPQTTDFFEFLADVSAAISTGKITQTQVIDICASVNVAALPMLINKPAELEMVATRFHEVLNASA
jgi:hypothetical protein